MVYYVFNRETGIKNRYQNKQELCVALKGYFDLNNKYYNRRADKEISKIMKGDFFRARIEVLMEETQRNIKIPILIARKDLLDNEDKYNKYMGS